MENIISISHNMSRTADFESLLEPYLHHLYKVAMRFTGGSVADSEDLVQELLIKLYSKQEQLAGIEKLRPWLVKVLYRTFIDHIRRQNRSPLHLVVKPVGDDMRDDHMDDRDDMHDEHNDTREDVRDNMGP